MTSSESTFYADQLPDPFLDVRVQVLDEAPQLTALCAGYELSRWRAEELANHLFDHLAEFALSWSALQRFNTGTGLRMLRQAARRVYTSEKYQTRGEFGELLLHTVVRQVFGSEPAISKIFFKNANNKTVEGFDCVHVVVGDDGLELWLGEVKFYSDIQSAMSAVVSELRQHTERQYLRDEFALIADKIDEGWPHAGALRSLLDERVSLDHVFKRLVVPVLLTYDSPAVKAHRAIDDPYPAAFEAEVRRVLTQFANRDLPSNLSIHLLLVPLESKEALNKLMDEKLKGLQA